MSGDVAEALAKLTPSEGQNFALIDLPDVEKTRLWDLLSSNFNLTSEERSLLVDAKRQFSTKEQLSRRDSSVVVTLKYSNRAKVNIIGLSPGDLTVSFLKSQAAKSWPEKLQDVEFHLEGGKGHTINDEFLEKCTAFPLHLTVKVDQSGFSDFMMEEKALSYAGVKKLEYAEDAEKLSLFPAKLVIDDSDPVLLHAYEDLKLKHALYDPIEQGCEYTRCEFISPILVLAATKAGVKLSCEEVVEGSRAKGPVDWMAHYNDHGICITEGKRDDIAGGIWQNIAQLTALGEKRGTKRTHEVDLPHFGVATTYREWVFIRLSPAGDAPRRAVRLPVMFATTTEQVKDVAECLAGILSSQKDLLDKASGGKAKAAKRVE
jgi:hypothetical protein